VIETKDTGEVYSWGLGNNGRLGHGDKKNFSVQTLIQSLKGKSVMQIACGWSHSMCLTDDGKVFCWGKGHDGRLGIAIAHDQLLPAQVHLKEHVITLSGGYCHSAVLTGHSSFLLSFYLPFDCHYDDHGDNNFV